MLAELVDHVFVNQHPGRVPIAHVDDSHRPAASGSPDTLCGLIRERETGETAGRVQGHAEPGTLALNHARNRARLAPDLDVHRRVTPSVDPIQPRELRDQVGAGSERARRGRTPEVLPLSAASIRTCA